MPRLHSGASTDALEITNLILPPISKVVWQQPRETHLTNIDITSTTETHKSTYMPEFRHRIDVESQTSTMNETSPQISGSSAEPFLENHTGCTAVQSLNDSKERQSEIQRDEMNITTDDNGDDNFSPPKIIYSKTEEQLLRDGNTNEL